MKAYLMAASVVALAAMATSGVAQTRPTPAEAKAFVENAEAQLQAQSVYAAKASWVRATYITEDTQWLEAKAAGEQKEMATRLAMEAARFNGVAVDPVTARKLNLLKLYLVLPAPDRQGGRARGPARGAGQRGL